ncbi:MAG: hypothetical protein HRT65_04230 [Flavobacteriaceae bacterium]|nr:hypothetical protein [Flavobacteriaceae bacterium]
MDNFEKHIREQAGQFDTHKADKDKMWAAISQAIERPEPKVIPLWKRPMAQIAAGIAILFGIGVFTALSIYNESPAETQFVSKELLEIDMHYQGLVSYQVRLVQNSPHLSASDKTEFLAFMDELDAEYALLREEMRNNLDNERVLEAIVANYKQRIALIENLLQQINATKNNEGNYGYTL